MEKLDYLRWYIGDTRIRNSKGYLINVNPYSENIYKSTIIYKIVNVFCIQIFYGSDEKDVYTVGYVALTNELRISG